MISLFLLFLLTPHVSANTTHTFLIKDKEEVLVLPEGYCDLTDSTKGQFFYNHIERATAQNPTLPQPAFVMLACEGEANSSYPWGYVTVPTAIRGMTQATFNSKVLALFGNQSYLQALDADIKQYEEDAVALNNEVFTAKFDSIDVGVPLIAKVSPWAIHSITKGAVVIEGKETIEHMYLSQAIIDGYIYFFYMITSAMSVLEDNWFELVDQAIQQSRGIR